MTVTLIERNLFQRKRFSLRALAGAFALFAVMTMPLPVLAYPEPGNSLARGLSAFARAQYASAARIFIPLAEAGDPVAQAHLGFMFETGRGVPQNYTEAAMWFRRAAEQGDMLRAIFTRPAL